MVPHCNNIICTPLRNTGDPRKVRMVYLVSDVKLFKTNNLQLSSCLVTFCFALLMATYTYVQLIAQEEKEKSDHVNVERKHGLGVLC